MLKSGSESGFQFDFGSTSENEVSDETIKVQAPVLTLNCSVMVMIDHESWLIARPLLAHRRNVLQVSVCGWKLRQHGYYLKVMEIVLTEYATAFTNSCYMHIP